jgi:hypothetical protein
MTKHKPKNTNQKTQNDQNRFREYGNIQIERENLFNDEYNRINNKLKNIQELCRDHATFLFENTTTMDFMNFLKKKKKNKYI